MCPLQSIACAACMFPRNAAQVSTAMISPFATATAPFAITWRDAAIVMMVAPYSNVSAFMSRIRQRGKPRNIYHAVDGHSEIGMVA